MTGASEPKVYDGIIQRGRVREWLRRWTRSLIGARGRLVSLGAILVVGLLLRLAYAYATNHRLPDTPARLIGDEPGYDNLAREMLDGLGYTWPGRVPLYPLWLAGVYLATGRSYAGAIYVQAVFSLVTIVLVYFLARRWFGELAALLAALASACSYVLAQQPLHILSEVLFTPAVLLVVLSLQAALAEPAPRRFAWAGLWVGISALIRPTLLFFPVFLALLLPALMPTRRAFRSALVCAAMAALVTVPWIVRNYIRHDAVFALTPSNAILWQGSPEYYHLVRDSGYSYVDVWYRKIYGPGWQANDPMSAQGDRYWTARALRSIAAEPLVYARYAAEKTITYWIGDPEADWNGERVFSYGALRRAGFDRPSAIMVLVARALIFPALLAAWMLRRRWRDLLPIYAVLAYCTLLHALTHAEARLSEPLQPLLLILIAGAVAKLAFGSETRNSAPEQSPAAG